MPGRLRFRLFRCLVLVLGLIVCGGYTRSQPPESGSNWWSLKPIAKPALPAVKSAKYQDWARNPIDQFVLARLLEKGLEPAPPADRRTLLRRVYFDLIGLPPTREEIESFVNDRAVDAYEKVVTRLLASPHFGERWARHWMDVIHFAETHGHDQDVPRDNAWPYRDYLIQSFNQDKPYGRFVEEQIAGDILYPEDPQATVALGFLAAGPWDESSLRDIRDDTLDRKAGQYLDRDDMIGTVTLSFLSTTVQCARCHDHKFDPISQEEYYGLQAVFAGVDRADRPYDPDPQMRKRRLALLKRKAELASASPALTRKLCADPVVAAVVSAWEADHKDSRGWTPVEATSVVSTMGAEPIKLPDLSTRFGGRRPEKDTYKIETVNKLPRITAVRLETLSDPALPHGGPGRQDNGNFHLSEFELEVLPQAKPVKAQKVVFSRALADFNQEGWDVGRAIDGNTATAWGIYPSVGKTHSAVFVLKEPLRTDGGSWLLFTLGQHHGGGHVIGRLRLSVTSDSPSDSLQPLPQEIRTIIQKPKQNRNETETAQLAVYVLREQVEKELACLPPPRLVYAAAHDFQPQGSFQPPKNCRPVHMLRRGDIRKPGKIARPAALSCVAGLERRFHLTRSEDEGQRRAALARWISEPHNPLTWRSIANRLWHYHFGRGIVATPSDFGRMGSPPSHPELLDWLAVRLLQEHGSLKMLHRLIVTSATYRQSSRHQPEFAKIDADNVYLWRMNRGPLDAESLHDAVLQVSGVLDTTMGGPSVRHFIQSPGIHRTPKVDYLAFDPDRPGGHRRSVYRFIFRTVPDPFMDALDCPDASQFTPVRSSSVTALQALALLNDQFMVRMTDHFARRVAGAGTVDMQVSAAFRLALGREPSAHEVRTLAAYAGNHGMANACRLLFNCNEFMYVP